MAFVLLDSTVLIDLLRGRTGALGRLHDLRSAHDIPATSVVNIEEIVRGLHRREEDVSRGLLTGLRLAPLGRTEGERAGRWRREFARRGTTLSQADCLIAAAAVGIGARLATANMKDFPMRELSLEHWPVGE